MFGMATLIMCIASIFFNVEDPSLRDFIQRVGLIPGFLWAVYFDKHERKKTNERERASREANSGEGSTHPALASEKAKRA